MLSSIDSSMLWNYMLRADQGCVGGVCTEPPPCLSSTIYGDDSGEVALLRKYRDEVLNKPL